MVSKLSKTNSDLSLTYVFRQNGVQWSGEFTGKLDPGGSFVGTWTESALSLPKTEGNATLIGKVLGARYVISGTWGMKNKREDERWVLDCIGP